jgi:hypothetical protein
VIVTAAASSRVMHDYAGGKIRQPAAVEAD